MGNLKDIYEIICKTIFGAKTHIFIKYKQTGYIMHKVLPNELLQIGTLYYNSVWILINWVCLCKTRFCS